MRNYIRTWIDRYLSDDAAITLALVLIISVTLFLTLGALLAPVLASFVVAYLLQGMVSLLQRLKLPHLIAVIITFCFFCTTLTLIIFMILPLVWEQMTHLFNELPRMIQQFQTLLKELPQQYPTFVSDEQVKSIVQNLSTQLGQAGQWLLSISASKIIGIVTLLVYFVLVPILVFFFLKDESRIAQGMQKFLPKNSRLIKQVMAEMNIQIANYVRGKVIEIIIVAIADYILFAWLGLHYAVLLAVLVGLSVIVPYIGAVVVTVPVVIISYLQWGADSEFILLVCVYGIIQIIDGNVLVPLLFGEAVNLHPVVIIMAVLIFGGLWGFWGVFFAIPLATLIKAVYNAWPKDELIQRA
ncbi:MAG: AI-2E family transporter [Endozoicomonadaceae bacterium]|nr:AI-2E family transporter [Endozoicomonadaceae bacterium]MCY4328555.1 AI-2E family transporter [Endozoicomonadaceae bacterium]